LSDVTACEDALRAKPDDVALLVAKGDALMQANRPADAETAYRHVAQLKPGDDAVKSKLSNAEALVAKTEPPPAAIAPSAVAANTTPSKAQKPARKPPALASAKRAPPEPPAPAVAALTPPESKIYSNDAPPGQTN
jgi:Flp pilus assembly protein TadD